MTTILWYSHNSINLITCKQVTESQLIQQYGIWKHLIESETLKHIECMLSLINVITIFKMKVLIRIGPLGILMEHGTMSMWLQMTHSRTEIQTWSIFRLVTMFKYWIWIRLLLLLFNVQAIIRMKLFHRR